MNFVNFRTEQVEDDQTEQQRADFTARSALPGTDAGGNTAAAEQSSGRTPQRHLRRSRPFETIGAHWQRSRSPISGPLHQVKCPTSIYTISNAMRVKLIFNQIQKFKISFQKFKNSKIQKFKNSKIQKFKISIQKFKNSKIQKFQFKNSKIQKFINSKFQKFKNSKFQKIKKFKMQ